MAEEANIENGRRAIWVIIAIALTVSVMGLASNIRTGVPFIIPTVRTVLTILLLYCLHEGYAWARWLSVGLYMIAGLAGIYFAFLLGWFFGVPIVILSLVLGGIAYNLAFSGNIKAFLDYQKSKRSS